MGDVKKGESLCERIVVAVDSVLQLPLAVFLIMTMSWRGKEGLRPGLWMLEIAALLLQFYGVLKS